MLLLLAADAARGQEGPATLRGFVTEAATGEPVPGANVALRGPDGVLRGTATDNDGYYQIGRIPPGRYVMQVTFIGYAPARDTLDIAAGAILTRSVTLAAAAGALDEVVVETEGGAARTEAGLQTVRPSDLARIPTPDPSGDLAGYLQAMPSVVAVGDRGGQLFIRGGTPDQNLVLIDQMLVYQPFHIIGFFSAFPEDLVAFADVYAGGFGGRFNGRISSVIDVQMREGNKRRFQGAVAASPFLASARLEGPIIPGHTSILASVRESMIEQTAPAYLGEELPFRFGDQFVKLHTTRRDDSRFALTALHTYDRGRIDPDLPAGDVFRWENLVVGARYLVFPSEFPVLLDMNTAFSLTENAVGRAADPERRSSAKRLSTEVGLTHYLGPLELHTGVFAQANFLSYRLTGQFQRFDAARRVLLGAGVYADGEWRLSPRLMINPSLVFSSYPLAYPAGLEPRLRVRWQPRGEEGPQEVSAAVGLYRQPIVGIRDERDTGSAFLAWMAAPLDGREAKAVHALVGTQRRLTPWLQVAAEGYYKRLFDLPVPIWSVLARFTTTLARANGDVYGYDVRVEVNQPQFYAYIGYGYSHTLYRASQDNFSLWFGDPVQRYHPPHDRRHQLNVVVSLATRFADVSVRWQVGSGLPYTQPIGFDDWVVLDDLADVETTYGEQRLLYAKPYQGRLPAYHRLDVSVERAFAVRSGALTVQAGAINTYDQANLFYYDLFTAQRVDQLPFIPFVSLKAEAH